MESADTNIINRKKYISYVLNFILNLEKIINIRKKARNIIFHK
jgi:hypothetical protein